MAASAPLVFGAWGLLTVDRARHRLPALSSRVGGMVTPVISSQAPHHRLHQHAPHGPFHGPLVAANSGSIDPLCNHLPRRGVFLLTASPLGEEEPDPEGEERGGYLPIPRSDARAGEWEFTTNKSILKRGSSTLVYHTRINLQKLS